MHLEYFLLFLVAEQKTLYLSLSLSRITTFPCCVTNVIRVAFGQWSDAAKKANQSIEVSSFGSKMFWRIRAFLLQLSHAVDPGISDGKQKGSRGRTRNREGQCAHAKKSSINNSYELRAGAKWCGANVRTPGYLSFTIYSDRLKNGP